MLLKSLRHFTLLCYLFFPFVFISNKDRLESSLTALGSKLEAQCHSTGNLLRIGVRQAFVSGDLNCACNTPIISRASLMSTGSKTNYLEPSQFGRSSEPWLLYTMLYPPCKNPMPRRECKDLSGRAIICGLNEEVQKPICLAIAGSCLYTCGRLQPGLCAA